MFPPARSVSPAGPGTKASNAPAADGALDLSGLEQRLKLITKQLEILRSPRRAEELVGELRQELAGIAETLDILVPRSAFGALEQEVRALAARLDSTRDTGSDAASVSKLQHGLAEIRDAISNLAPTELGEAVQTLSHKVDQIGGGGVDPLTLQQLDAATSSLRSIVTQVASGGALAALVNEVQALGAKIDRSLPNGSAPAPASIDRDLLLVLEREVNGIAATLSAKAGQVPAPAVEPLIETIMHKLDRFDLFADDPTVFAPIKAHISELGDKIDRLQPPQTDLEASAPLETRLGELGERIEDLQPPHADPDAYAPLEVKLGHLTDTIERINTQGIDQPVLVALEEGMRAIAAKLDRLEENTPARADIGPLEHRIAELAEKLDASEARLGNLEAIEYGMTELINRLDEIRQAAGVRVQPAAASAGPQAALPAATQPIVLAALREPAAKPLQFGPDHQGLATGSPGCEPDLQGVASRPLAIASDRPRLPSGDEAFKGRRAGDRPRLSTAGEREPAGTGLWFGSSPQIDPVQMPGPVNAAAAASTREPAEPARAGPAEAPANVLHLPADVPIEPDSGPPRARRSATERIAASQAMLGPMPTDRTIGTKAGPNFIIAARRAAQAASEQRGQFAAAAVAAGDIASGSVRQVFTGRVRSLSLTGGAILLALGATGIMLSIGDQQNAGGPAPRLAAAPAATTIVREQPSPAAVGDPTAALPPMPAALWALSSPTIVPAVQDTDPGGQMVPVASAAVEAERGSERPPAVASVDVTGSVGASRAMRSVPPAQPLPSARPEHESKGNTWSDSLPPALKTKPLVAGVAAHNPGAAYEIALRYAEGRGVDTDMAAAVTWFARAAEGGVVPAQFRLGGLYEKGVGVKKDLPQARCYYLAAANRGHALAMHNLAVLYAEGVDGKADFSTAVKWFRKGAEYGVTDSQYNAAVLLAGGIGIERNLGEAYKWFAVAAKGGDKIAAKKRDEIGESLDAQTLAAARLAASGFVPKPQPEEATAVHAPATGWDDVVVTPKPRARSRRRGERSARL
jgi:localization factor PodJL